MKYSIPDNVIKIMEIIQSNEYEAYLVGGCVRDILLGREPSDYDIATSAQPNAIEKFFEDYKILNIGRKHGTITVIMDNVQYEITTYRIEGKYTDNRRPDSVIFTSSLSEDLKRRDFSINAIAMDSCGKITDELGGVNDLHSGKIRFIGNAEERIKEDALRIMRAVRFEAQLGFKCTEESKAAVMKYRGLLENISVERLRAEFDKILVTDNADNILQKYRDVIAVFIPEIKGMFDFDQQNPFHCYDVYEHDLHAVKMIEADKTLRLTAFFHDIGKPDCFIVKDDWGHFYYHEKKSSEITEKVLRRLKYSNETIEDVCFVIGSHATVFTATEKYAKHKLNLMGEKRLRMLIELEKADVRSQAYSVREKRVRNIEAFESCLDKVIAEEQCFQMRDMAINGKDIIDAGYKEGKDVGIVLNKLLNEIINGEIENDRFLLLEKIKSGELL